MGTFCETILCCYWEETKCRNPSLGLATKARGCKVAGQVRDMLSGVQRVWGNEPSHPQVNSHVGSWSPERTPESSVLGVGVPKGLLNLQSAIAGAKSPCLEEFFISLKRFWSVDVQNGLAWAIWTSATQVMGKRKTGSQTANLREKDSRPLKVKNRPDLLGFRSRATYRWKALDEGYNFALDRTAIRGLQKKLCALKVPGVLVDGISGLPRGSPRREKPFGCRPRGESQSIL
jgi:hypothetical protein